MRAYGSSLNYASIPGGSWVEGPNIYLAFFPSETLTIEPEASLQWESRNEQGFTLLGLTARGKYLFRDAAQSSPYLAGQIGLLVERDNNPPSEPQDDIDTAYSFGGGLGYRSVLSRSFALSVEARYRRWTGDYFGDERLNELGVVLAVGALVPR